jgi:hypothetical protein
MTVNVQPVLEGQVKIYGAEAGRTKIAYEHLKMSLEQAASRSRIACTGPTVG